MASTHASDLGASFPPPDRSATPAPRPPICGAAKRWGELWKELEFGRAVLLGQAAHVKADRFGPHVELIPQLFDLGRGRRFISIGIKYDAGPGKKRETGSVAFGQFLNLALADWEITDQLWQLLRVGDLGVSFQDLDVINGNFDRATKAADQYEKDCWVQRVWELKVRLEQNAKAHTLGAVRRIRHGLHAHGDADTALVRDGVVLPATLLEPDPTREQVTRFRINQGMYGDHSYFIDRPDRGEMTVHGISTGVMIHRAAEVERELRRRWLVPLARTLDELMALTAQKRGAALARVIESATVARKLNDFVSAFWAMWADPRFSANADFEVVTDHERRAEKYMDILVQRTLRTLLKEAVEAVGTYPYGQIDRYNYGRKIHALKEALRRTSHVLGSYAHAGNAQGFRAAREESDRLVTDFRHRVLGDGPGSPARATARA